MTPDEAKRIDQLVQNVTRLFRAEGKLDDAMPIISTALTEIVAKWLSTFEEDQQERIAQRLIAFALKSAREQPPPKGSVQ